MMSKTTNNASGEDIQNLSYEQAFADLEKIVRQLEGEQDSLESTLALFERGQKLVERCTILLEQAELRLQVLSEVGPGDMPVEADQEE